MKRLLLPLAITWACCVGAAAPSHAADDRSTTVRYADLDLASAKGQAALQRRIAFAVRQVCGDPGLKTAQAYQQEQTCEADARREVGESVTRLAFGRSSSGGMVGEQAIVAPERPDWP